MLVTGDHDLLNLNLDDLEISRRDRALTLRVLDFLSRLT
jgi:hypothetical protein